MVRRFENANLNQSTERRKKKQKAIQNSEKLKETCQIVSVNAQSWANHWTFARVTVTLSLLPICFWIVNNVKGLRRYENRISDLRINK